MNFFLHEFVHIILSFLVGYLVWKRYQKLIVSLIASILGGVLVDLDHFFDYFLAFGFKFNPNYFLKGYQFLKSDKIYLPAHSWELAIIIFLIFLYLINFKNFKTLKTLLLSFSLTLMLHLIVDIPANNMHFKSYFLSYRIINDFQLKTMVTPTHYQNHLLFKKRFPNF